MPPTVTIVSPCYNHSRYIVEHLESVRAQDYPYIQHIIFDDGSSDRSADVIEKWIADNSYECTFIRHERNRGLCSTLNEAIALAKGEYWSAIGTDDTMLPHRTRLLAEYLDAHPECMMVSGDSLLMDLDSRPSEVDGHASALAWSMRNRPDFDWRRDYGSYEWMLMQNHLPAPMLRTEVFGRVGLFDPSLKLEDWDMWLRIAEFSRPAFIDDVVGHYRLHPTNASKDSTMMSEQSMITFLKYYDRGHRRHPEACETLLKVHFNDCVLNPKSIGNMRHFMRPSFLPVVIGETARWVAAAIRSKLNRGA